MVIYFGADHRGFELKARLMEVLRNQGYEVVDMGAAKLEEEDDYPDFAEKVAEKISAEQERVRGVLICGSGAGMAIVANKFQGVRAALAVSSDQVYAARHDDDANVLAIAADFTERTAAEKFLEVFMTTPFAGDQKYKRRLEKVAEVEEKNFVRK